jgi:hypothetical protein
MYCCLPGWDDLPERKRYFIHGWVFLGLFLLGHGLWDGLVIAPEAQRWSQGNCTIVSCVDAWRCVDVDDNYYPNSYYPNSRKRQQQSLAFSSLDISTLDISSTIGGVVFEEQQRQQSALQRRETKYNSTVSCERCTNLTLSLAPFAEKGSDELYENLFQDCSLVILCNQTGGVGSQIPCYYDVRDLPGSITSSSSSGELISMIIAILLFSLGMGTCIIVFCCAALV